MSLVDQARKLATSLPLPEGHWKDTLRLRAIGLLKIPMIFFIGPSVETLTDERVVVRVPLHRRNRNHLGSMYFGVLAAGADCAGGLIAWKLLEEANAAAPKGSGKISLVFKDFHAEFLKRPEGDVLFTCTEGAAIRELVNRAAASGERENMPVHITATCPNKTGDEPVAKFTLTLSLKKK